MSEKKYIDIKKRMEQWGKLCDSYFPNLPCERLEDFILRAPAADVVEIRHGYWILWKPRCENRNATYKCSVCGKLRSSYYNDVGEWEYSPCGARMDGERKENP